ncbi:1-deoxy-D-xylulose-5-phosphate synthase N-terminal domain-containing protein [Streptomyces sp. GC420]|uniref:1-deoxy-D-xylulose-5-phosphate synthase N-terminal domain-containing protein n=1 Tax=Streptomyces sp. GC420 TaxID=2697568 RepID=UPI001414D86B|nr:1-deoxy-D-xylulose-5-phosphate synthase N-terminal domain-containing protein [Streptomyces sp. GC420]NBM18202.1 transketolase [Streptomyces sp. GC420]
MSGLYDRFAGPARAALPRLTSAERDVVLRELDRLRSAGRASSLFEGLREVAAQVPERLYGDSAEVLLRMHEIAGSGNLQSNLSSLPLVRACFELGLVPGNDRGAPAELVVGRGHIAPAFYAEHYVRGALPFAPLATLHHGLTGVVHRDLGFRNTMRYSLGVGVVQAVGLAWELARRGDDRKVVCLAGDGELHEGAAFEALRFAHDAGLTNLVLVVDANGKGIEPLAKPVNTRYLSAFLGRLTEADGRDERAVRAALGELLAAPGSSVLVCRTAKGDHSFRPAGAARPVRAPFASTAGRMLARHRARAGRDMTVFTADMAARFGLRGHVPYTNTGLAETLTVGMALSLPEDTLKVVATDAMYYMDSLSMLTEATTSVRNLLVLAGRSWGAWGGAHNATNLLGLLLHSKVYEPVTEAEFAACLDRLGRDPATAHVISMVDAAFDPPARDCSGDIDGAVWLTPPDEGRTDAAVVTFGYAGVLVDAANRGLGVPHLHCAALAPRLAPADVAVLRGSRRLLSVEYNGARGGFGEGLRTRYLLPAEVHGVRRDIAQQVHPRQLELHGMSPVALRERLSRLLESREAGRAPAHA